MSIINIQEDIILAPYTTFKIGGEAKYFCEVKNEYELEEAIKYAKDNNLAAFVMGGFHSRVIFQALKDRDYTVLLVSPRFKPEDEKTAQEQYLKMLKYKWTGKSEIPASEFKSPNSKFGNLDPKQV